MFVIEDKRHGVTTLVFTVEDPRKDGFKGNVVEGADLEYDMEAVHRWLDGQPRPEPCVGRAPNNPKQYTVFKSPSHRRDAGYEAIEGSAVKLGSWRDYQRLHLLPPDPDSTEDEPWFAYLDRLDEDSRRRRQREEAPDEPEDKSRDAIAAWVAKKHFFADSSVREIWYLPQGAPPDEIRLLELNDRIAGPESRTEAIDFGLEVNGASFRLFVADVTSDELDEIRSVPSRLPLGWSLDNNRVWRRGA